MKKKSHIAPKQENSMKNFKPKWIYFIIIILSFFWLSSCSEEIVIVEEVDRTELDSLDNLIQVTTDDITSAQIANDALKRRVDSLNAVLKAAGSPTASNPDVVYTVQVINGGESYINGRAKSLSNAVVTVSQGNIATQLTTGNTGMVTFPKMNDGIVSVTVEIDNYADVYMIVDLRDDGKDPRNTSATYRNASTQVMVYPTSGKDMFTISGVAYYNQNETNLRTNGQNDPFHPLTGAAIYETAPAGSSFSIRCTPSSIPLNHTRPGKILQVVYAGLERVALIGNNGVYSVSVPAILRAANGTSFFTYGGPNVVSAISGVRQTDNGSFNTTWLPSLFWPVSLPQMVFYPGGKSFTDIYYF